MNVQLWVYVEGYRKYSEVSIPSTQKISDLKKQIYPDKDQGFYGLISLEKVRHIMISI